MLAIEVLSMAKQNTLTIEADEGYSVKLVTRRRVLIESPVVSATAF